MNMFVPCSSNWFTNAVRTMSSDVGRSGCLPTRAILMAMLASIFGMQLIQGMKYITRGQELCFPRFTVSTALWVKRMNAIAAGAERRSVVSETMACEWRIVPINVNIALRKTTGASPTLQVSLLMLIKVTSLSVGVSKRSECPALDCTSRDLLHPPEVARSSPSVYSCVLCPH